MISLAHTLIHQNHIIISLIIKSDALRTQFSTFSSEFAKTKQNKRIQNLNLGTKVITIILTVIVMIIITIMIIIAIVVIIIIKMLITIIMAMIIK